MKLGKYLTVVAVFGVVAGSALPANAASLSSVDTGWYRDDGFHRPNNPNYIAGSSWNTYNNFGVFDTSGIQGTVTSAILKASMPANGYGSSNPTEIWGLYDVTTDINSLRTGNGGINAYNDLGSGINFGAQITTSNSDQGNFVEVVLNSDAISSLNSSSALWAVGGTCETCSSNSDYIFGYSGSQPWQLEVEAVPEPTTILGTLTALGFGGFLKRKCAKKA